MKSYACSKFLLDSVDLSEKICSFSGDLKMMPP